MAVKWEKVSQAIFGTKYDYNQERLHDADEGSVCVQGALWLGMKNSKEEEIEKSDALSGAKEEKVCRYYGLERRLVSGIPGVNDDASGNVPKTVFAWLWLTHDKKRMEALKALSKGVSNYDGDGGSKDRARRLLKKFDGEITESIERVLTENGIEDDLVWAAGVELLAPSFGAQYLEEAKKIRALDALLKGDSITKDLHRRLANLPPTGGWKKYIQKAKKR